MMCEAVPTFTGLHGEKVGVGQPTIGQVYIEIDATGAVLESRAAMMSAHALEATA
jgi:hypothetical protein